MAVAILPILLTLVASLIGAFGALFLKFGSEKFTLNILKLIRNYYLAIGVFCYALGVVMYIYALKFAEISALYPIAATTYIWISLLSVKFLKESMDKWKWSGIVLILIGVTLIGFGS